MTTIDEYTQIWSDFHKEAYGFRPRGPLPEWTVEEWQAEFDRLGRMCEENRQEAEARQAVAAGEFEALIVKLLGHGAADRATAIRWLHEAHNTDGDNEYLCYCLGLKYGYLSKE